ncbi:ATP-binding protein [Streptomyces griseoaurantiacus]|uniref:histidine kinase n=1 Tax=Streptomyces griseoaurantiacus TaxID=68213 RepID=A0A1G7DHW9_9ACTN|nr:MULTISPECIES: ATP-binding protein [Streptomyces]SDE51059.1 Signal transduction histidine kinase [Streptomyces jietaisiensis]
MNVTEPRRRRWWPLSVRARTALAVALVTAVVLVGVGAWVHREIYRESEGIAENQARTDLFALVHQVRNGSVPGRGSTAPYEIVATGRRTAVASGGGMEDFDPEARHVLPTPPARSSPDPLAVVDEEGWGYGSTTLRIPERGDYRPAYGEHLAGRTYTVLYNDVWAGEMSKDRAAAMGVAPDATLRVYTVLLPDTAEEIADTTDGLLLRAGLFSLVLIGAAAYFTVRLALRPIEAIRVLTASVTPNDPRERITLPATGHEISALATTLNGTLQRLDDAAAQQRRFVADASHELRSPLTTLLASLEVALAYPERTDWPATATTAARQTRRLQELAEDLLLLARLDTRASRTDPAIIDLAALAARLTEEYPPGERTLDLTCEATGHAYVHGNSEELERLLRNLLDNAARHAAHLVRVTVRKEEDDEVVVTVHDDGPGVPPEDAERVFERFVRLDDARSRDQGGTGLGLAIARDVAARHGGTLTLAPRTLGACFRLSLPGLPVPAEV